jgi:hypothetical protein
VKYCTWMLSWHARSHPKKSFLFSNTPLFVYSSHCYMVWTNKKEGATVIQANVCLRDANASIFICKHQNRCNSTRSGADFFLLQSWYMSVDRFAVLLLHLILPLNVSVFCFKLRFICFP